MRSKTSPSPSSRQISVVARLDLLPHLHRDPLDLTGRDR